MILPAAQQRAQDVIRTANLQDIFALERCALGQHNEVWFYGPYVLRVSPGGDTLAQEAHILRTLPSGVPHAPVVSVGDGWMIQRRVPGDPLSAVWTTLSAEKQRAAVQQLAAILINLHQLRISGLPSLSPGWFPAILPANILKLTAQQRERDPALLDAIALFTRRTMATITPPLRWGFVHRQLSFDHLLWNGERITALLDFECALLAPRELELEMIVRSCRYPPDGSPPDDFDAVLPWLHEDYPLLFSEPGIEQRLRLYSIERDLRLLADDPGAADRLRATIEA